jgi:hypothetical protein
MSATVSNQKKTAKGTVEYTGMEYHKLTCVLDVPTVNVVVVRTQRRGNGAWYWYVVMVRTQRPWLKSTRSYVKMQA